MQLFIIIQQTCSRQNLVRFSLCRLLKHDDQALFLSDLDQMNCAWFNLFILEPSLDHSFSLFNLPIYRIKPLNQKRLTSFQRRALGSDTRLNLSHRQPAPGFLEQTLTLPGLLPTARPLHA